LGISLAHSSESTLRNNLMKDNDYNFGVYGEEINDFYQDIDESNLVNGKPVYYVIGESDIAFENMEIGYLGLVSCDNVTIENITIENNSQGLLVVNTINSIVGKCNLSNNEIGINLYRSPSDEIIDNIINSNEIGILLERSSHNILAKNAVNSNSYGIF
jgi:parallel beta-helix repeat protein